MHHAIIGMTRSGKTTLAKLLAADYQRNGIGVAVLDPALDKWPADFQTGDPEKFLDKIHAMALTRRQWVLFVDECLQSLRRHDKRMTFLGTGIAKCGFRCFFLSQYPKDLNPNVRGSIETWWLFRHENPEFLAKKNPLVMETANYGKGEFLKLTPFEIPIHGQIAWGKNITVELKPLPPLPDHRSTTAKPERLT